MSEALEPPASKGEQTKRTLLNAAIERFGRDGFRSSSVAEITRDAGLSGTAAYAYFDNKEALFLAALDQDAAGIIREAVDLTPIDDRAEGWRETLFLNLLEAIDRHPLARRVLGGFEPQVASRIIDLPALADLRVIVGERLRIEQQNGTVRPDIDPEQIGSGLVDLQVSLLFSVVQLGSAEFTKRAPDLMAVFAAAVDAPKDDKA